ncbi:heavy metal-associated domain-containing protein [Pigmentiphaga sp. CHJ604]|uniref:heavy metal-associated domain-containing protein n=1 Tax=Pigmentiphaga sp. CHJ604 TaxID=3081984 RepID=UPI0030CF81AD
MSTPRTSDAGAAAATISLPIEGMTCASCVGRGEAALAKGARAGGGRREVDTRLTPPRIRG